MVVRNPPGEVRQIPQYPSIHPSIHPSIRCSKLTTTRSHNEYKWQNEIFQYLLEMTELDHIKWLNRNTYNIMRPSESANSCQMGDGW